MGWMGRKSSVVFSASHVCIMCILMYALEWQLSWVGFPDFESNTLLSLIIKS